MEVKKMNTEEAIEFVRLTRLESGVSERKDYDDIISLLKRGEVYEKMWEELDDDIGYSDYDILQKMEELKQKHFPKE